MLLIRRPAHEQVDEMPVVRHHLAGDLRVRPVGAPDQPFRIGAHERGVEGLRIRVIQELPGQAIGRRQLGVDRPLADQAQQRLERRIVDAAPGRNVDVR